MLPGTVSAISLKLHRSKADVLAALQHLATTSSKLKLTGETYSIGK